MSASTNYIKADAMPPQTIKPLATGATSPMQSAQIHQQQLTQQQMRLIGKTGGRKRHQTKRKKIRGGAAGGVANNAQIVVPAVPPGAVNSAQTQNEYAMLTQLASKQQSEAVFDEGNTAAVAATQKGGRKIKGARKMRGGSWPVWGCLSGGKKSKRKHRRKTRNTRKTRKTKK